MAADDNGSGAVALRAEAGGANAATATVASAAVIIERNLVFMV